MRSNYTSLILCHHDMRRKMEIFHSKCIRIGVFCFDFDAKKKNTCRHRMRNPFLAKTNKVFSGVVCTAAAAPIDRSNDNNTNSSNRIVCLMVVSSLQQYPLTAAVTIKTTAATELFLRWLFHLLQQHQSIASTTITSSAATALFGRWLFHHHSNTNQLQRQQFKKAATESFVGWWFCHCHSDSN